MNARDYITSERFIHDVLAERAANAVKKLPGLWKTSKKIDASLFLWPAAAVTTDDGYQIDGVTVLSLPVDKTAHLPLIRGAIARMHAYAFLLVRNEGRCIRALFESPHGTRAWILPIRRSADTWVLGRAEIKDDKETLHLLWSPQRGNS